MGSFFENIWSGGGELRTQIWQWFNSLSREEWMLTLIVVCAMGFLCMLGLNSRRV
jgi:hypothetical protein